VRFGLGFARLDYKRVCIGDYARLQTSFVTVGNVCSGLARICKARLWTVSLWETTNRSVMGDYKPLSGGLLS
jgi:hypothetical protein